MVVDDNSQLDMMNEEGFFGNFFDMINFSEIMDSACDGSSNNCGDNYYCDNTQISSASHGEAYCGVTLTSKERKIVNETNANDKDWVTKFLDPKFNIDIPATFVPANDFIDEDEFQFQTLSPNSVLDEPKVINNDKQGSSSSLISLGPDPIVPTTMPVPIRAHTETPVRPTMTEIPPQACVWTPARPTTMPITSRARTKRHRRPSSAYFTAPIIAPFAEGPPTIPTFLDSIEKPLIIPRTRKINKKEMSRIDNSTEGIMALRKCKHCGISKTPQWRAGPMGPKTLCNACGVRYKSGRLYPEYRPAASPTFMPSLHSNSHRKVVEMRNRAATGAKNCELLAYIYELGVTGS